MISSQQLCTDRYRHVDNTPPMEAPKSLPQSTASILMAALDPSIEGESPIKADRPLFCNV